MVKVARYRPTFLGVEGSQLVTDLHQSTGDHRTAELLGYYTQNLGSLINDTTFRLCYLGSGEPQRGRKIPQEIWALGNGPGNIQSWTLLKYDLMVLAINIFWYL